MEPTASAACRDILDRLQAQVDAQLPRIEHCCNSPNGIAPASMVPIERLPTIGAVVQQLIEAEAVYAGANQPLAPGNPDQQPHDVTA